MRAKHVLGILLAFDVLAGALDARDMALHTAASLVPGATTLVLSFLCFYWYRLDSEERGYRRNKWLTTGVVMFALVGVPYYLARSRAAGHKARALLRFAGFALLQLVAVFIGGVAGAIVFGLS